MKLRTTLDLVIEPLTRALILLGLCLGLAEATAKPRTPFPPMPEIAPVLWHEDFDELYSYTNTSAQISVPGFGELVEGWSGFALQRSGMLLNPLIVPGLDSGARPLLATNAGATRFWLTPYWSSTSVTNGTGPGIEARLVEFGAAGNNQVAVCWSLQVSPDGNALVLVGQTDAGQVELLRAGIDWQANQSHLLCLDYGPQGTALLVDGQLCAWGAGTLVVPPQTGRLVIGSSFAGTEAAECAFDEIYTFGRPLGTNDLTFYYGSTRRQAALGPITEEELAARRAARLSGTTTLATMSVTATAGPPMPGGDPGPTSEGGDSVPATPAYNYPSNSFWVEMVSASNNLASVVLHGTVQDMVYEILSKQGLSNEVVWVSEGTLLGAAGQDWTPAMVTIGTRTNGLFLQARSWVDGDGNGLPDWWELQHFSTTGVDAYADPDEDGWTNIQEYQNGTSPTSFNTPPAPRNVLAQLNGTNVVITWESGGGSVTNFIISRADPDEYGGLGSFHPIAQANPGTSMVLDQGSFTLGDALMGQLGSVYQVQAQYAYGRSVSASASINPNDHGFALDAKLIRGPNARWQLAFSAIPATVQSIQITWQKWDYVYDLPGSYTTEVISTNSLTNGTYLISDLKAVNCLSNIVYVQGIGPDGKPSARTRAGMMPGDAPYFVDGRQHLRENLLLLIRGAGITQPLPVDVRFPATLNCAESSFIHPDLATKVDIFGSPFGVPFTALDNVFPIEANYTLYNLLFDHDPEQAPDPFPWQPDFNPMPAPPVLTLPETNAYWIEAPGTLDWGITENLGGTKSLGAGLHNAFGLPFQTARYLCYDWDTGLPFESLLEPGDTTPVRLSFVHYWTQTPKPSLTPVGYYFAPVITSGTGLVGDANPPSQVYPVPLTSDFDPATPTPLMIGAVGQPMVIGGWSKQRVGDGSSGRLGYLGQYFDQAYKVDSAGNPTTPTGVLSPYGEFFPTEPGPVALATMADQTGQRGTGVVNVIKLQLDVNHDGNMDLSFGGPDNTSENRPFAFWINNDCDWATRNLSGNPTEVGNDQSTAGGYYNDYKDIATRSQRDLEDFARLWLCGMPALPANQGYQVTLSLANASASTFAVNLVNAVEADGGTGYLTDTNIAAAQVAYNDFSKATSPGYKFARLTTSQSYTFPDNYFTNSATKHFLFEGAGIGSGQLVLTVSQVTPQGTNVIAETGAWLDLRDVKDFFEQAYATNVTSGKPPSSLVSDFSVIQTAASPMPDETKQIIVFIHGINNTITDYETTTRIIFKRLYWAGYHGRFASFRWPCAYLPPTTANPFQYNLGEFYAFKSATALKNYLSYLKNNRPDLTDYAIDLYAHSQGNVVTSEAVLQGAPFDNYILTQGAFPAHCYDTNAPFQQKLLDAETNSVNAKETPFYPVNGGYHGYCSPVHGNLIDFYNTNDFALATGTTLGLQTNWEEDQRAQKPEAFFGGPSYIYYPSNLTTVAYYTFSSYTVTDLQEIKALVARSRSKAVGAQGGLHGAISSSVDLSGSYGFGNTRPEHSAQFARPIQTCLLYYRQMLTSFQIVTP